MALASGPRPHLHDLLQRDLAGSVGVDAVEGRLDVRVVMEALLPRPPWLGLVLVLVLGLGLG